MALELVAGGCHLGKGSGVSDIRIARMVARMVAIKIRLDRFYDTSLQPSFFFLSPLFFFLSFDVELCISDELYTAR